jgi:lysozyme
MGTSEVIDIAADLCRHFEGFSAKPYICPAGYPTIGYGSCFYPDGRRVTMSDPAITMEQADGLLHADLLNFYNSVVSFCPGVVGQSRRAAALLDFTYNLGAARLKASTLRRRVNEGDWDQAKVELMRWVRGGGRILPGLVRRRQAEVNLI